MWTFSLEHHHSLYIGLEFDINIDMLVLKSCVNISGIIYLIILYFESKFRKILNSFLNRNHTFRLIVSSFVIIFF